MPGLSTSVEWPQPLRQYPMAQMRPVLVLDHMEVIFGRNDFFLAY